VMYPRYVCEATSAWYPWFCIVPVGHFPRSTLWVGLTEDESRSRFSATGIATDDFWYVVVSVWRERLEGCVGVFSDSGSLF
jgi:hypothetical protein